jgi:Mce-associated membrane protein
MTVINRCELGPTNRKRIMTTVGVLLLVAMVATAVQATRAYHAVESEHAGRAAMAAASTELPAVLSYNVVTLDADLARGRSFTTGQFGEEYSKLVASTIGPVAKSKQVVTSATIAANSVITATPGKVTLLTYVDQQSSNVDQPTPRLDTSRLMITMTNSNGRWLISDLSPM